jgi:hypothetical protein
MAIISKEPGCTGCSALISRLYGQFEFSEVFGSLRMYLE